MENSGTLSATRGQAIRYGVVGAWNTVFGYGCYSFFTLILTGLGPHSYMLANLIAFPINITVAFLGYKLFVFKTKGNYIREWLRCIVVYSGTFVLSLVALPALVFCIRRLGGLEKAAPYIAGAIVIGATAVVSFFGHKHISFAGRADEELMVEAQRVGTRYANLAKQSRR
jgi:putative flippase GtrA